MKKYFLLISFLFFVVSSFSQTGTIRGFVSDKNTGESIMFCNVTIDGTSHGSQTDLNGMYTLSKIPVGKHKIVVTFIGYKKFTQEISLNKGQILTLRFELESKLPKLIKLKSDFISTDSSFIVALFNLGFA